jgi:hypothetical protein
MRFLRQAKPMVAAGALLASLMIGGAAAASTTYNDTIQGAEYSATSTQGRFGGYAYGALPGLWNAVVNHTVLSPNATITSGRFTLDGPTDASGDFIPGGNVTLQNPSSLCVNQYYTVDGTLGNVVVGASTGGTGTFHGTLTHLRRIIFGRCITYSATISGTLTLSA